MSSLLIKSLWRTLIFPPWGFYFAAKAFENKAEELDFYAPSFADFNKKKAHERKVGNFRNIATLFQLLTCISVAIIAFCISNLAVKA